MANRQKVPAMGGSGVMALQPTRAVPVPVGLKREYAGNGMTEFLSEAADVANVALQKKKKSDFETMTYETDETLQKYRAQLTNAQSSDEFEMIAQAAEDDLKNRFSDRFNGAEYWAERGGDILRENRKDIEKLRQKKNFDFGKNSLDEMLANNQNLLAHSAGKKGGVLLDRAVAEIDATPFLQDEEKKQYRDGYLKTGILNLALNDPEQAQSMADKYLPDFRDELKKRIDNTQALRKAYEQEENKRQQRAKDIADYQQAFSYWQAKEEGSINPAEFYVLTAENKPDTLWGEREQRSATPLADAYRIIKKINSGDKLSADEMRDAGNSLIAAYKQNKIGLEEVGELHNQLMLAEGDKSSSGLLFDKDVDELADRVLMPDVEATAGSPYAQEFMEEKAKLAFQIYENYYSKKTALADEFAEQGGMITPALEKRFRKQALAETRAEMGIVENSGEDVSASSLRRVLKNVYTGQNERDIWRKFYAKAPYAEDKKALFKQIAAEEQRRELSYPQFSSLEELENAQLLKGEKFYFKGRLAVKV